MWFKFFVGLSACGAAAALMVLGRMQNAKRRGVTMALLVCALILWLVGLLSFLAMFIDAMTTFGRQ